MSQLDLLWELDKHIELLNKYKEKVDLKSQKEQIENLNIRMGNLENKLKSLEDRISECNFKIKKEELRLRGLQEQIKEIDKELYSGEISDLRELEYLSNEKESIQKEADNLESLILNIMEEEENIVIDVKEAKFNLEKQQNYLLEINKEYERNVEIFNKNLLEEESIINNLKDQIESNLLEIYFNIKKRKKRPIVIVNNNICTGCNMSIPTYLLSELRNQKELVYCSNCGRILYYNSDITSIIQ